MSATQEKKFDADQPNQVTELKLLDGKFTENISALIYTEEEKAELLSNYQDVVTRYIRLTNNPEAIDTELHLALYQQIFDLRNLAAEMKIPAIDLYYSGLVALQPQERGGYIADMQTREADINEIYALQQRVHV